MNKHFYSPSTEGFYHSEVHETYPEDSVEVTNEEYVQLLEDQSEGKQVYLAPNGKVSSRDYVRSTEEQAELDKHIAKEQKRKAKLEGIDYKGKKLSATAEDMWGLVSVASWVEAGNTVNFQFDNGTKLKITPQNVEEIKALWIPFRMSFFADE